MLFYQVISIPKYSNFRVLLLKNMLLAELMHEPLRCKFGVLVVEDVCNVTYVTKIQDLAIHIIISMVVEVVLWAMKLM